MKSTEADKPASKIPPDDRPLAEAIAAGLTAGDDIAVEIGPDGKRYEVMPDGRRILLPSR